MPHRVLHIQQDHPAQAEQECGHAAVPQDAIWCPINADEVRYVDVLREHGKDVVNKFGRLPARGSALVRPEVRDAGLMSDRVTS